MGLQNVCDEILGLLIVCDLYGFVMFTMIRFPGVYPEVRDINVHIVNGPLWTAVPFYIRNFVWITGPVYIQNFVWITGAVFIQNFVWISGRDWVLFWAVAGLMVAKAPLD